MITSLSNDKIKHVISLRDKKRVRDEENLFITEGIKLFEDAPENMTVEVYLTGAFLRDLSNNNRNDLLECSSHCFVPSFLYVLSFLSCFEAFIS